MTQLSEEALTNQLTSLLKAYSAAANDAGMTTPITTSGDTILLTGDIANSLSSLTNLPNLTTMTQIPTSFTGIVNMLPSTGIFSVQSMIWSTVWTFVVLWLLWYSKEKAKAKIWAKAFHKQAKKFIKEYREEELEHEKEMKRAVANIIADLPTSTEAQTTTPPDMNRLLSSISTAPQVPNIQTPPTAQ